MPWPCPGSLSQRSFWTSSREVSSSFMSRHPLGAAVAGGGAPGSRVIGVGARLVVDGQVGLGHRDGVELLDAEAQRGRLGHEAAPMAQHVLHVLGADVAGLHHLVDRARRDARAEQLDEQDEPDGLATNGAASPRPGA